MFRLALECLSCDDKRSICIPICLSRLTEEEEEGESKKYFAIEGGLFIRDRARPSTTCQAVEGEWVLLCRV